MAVTTCRECGVSLRTEPIFCPGCGARRPAEAPRVVAVPVRTPVDRNVFGILLLAAVTIFAVGAWLFGGSEPAPAPVAAPSQPTTTTTTTVVVQVPQVVVTPPTSSTSTSTSTTVNADGSRTTTHTTTISAGGGGAAYVGTSGTVVVTTGGLDTVVTVDSQQR